MVGAVSANASLVVWRTHAIVSTVGRLAAENIGCAVRAHAIVTGLGAHAVVKVVGFDDPDSAET